MSTDVREQVRQLTVAFDVFVDDVTADDAIQRLEAQTAISEPDRSQPPSLRANRWEWSRFGVAAAAATLVVGLVAALVWVDRDSSGPASAPPASTVPPPATTTSLGQFVWPAPPQGFATPNELITAFTSEVLGWTAFEVQGDVSEQAQPQSFTLSNSALDASVAATAIPSTGGWGFVQIGAAITATADGGTVVLQYPTPTPVVSSSITLRLTDGTTMESTSTSDRAAMRDVEFDQLVSALVIGLNAEGNAVAVAGGQFASDAPGVSAPALEGDPPGTNTAPDPAPGGAMILDQLPASLADAQVFTYVGTFQFSEPPFPANYQVQRWYTATMDQPELQPHLKLASTSTKQEFPPDIPPRNVNVTEVTVRGGAAWLYDDGFREGRVIAFQDEETIFVLTGYQISDDELLRAAEHTMLVDSGVGAAIATDGLPAGLIERAVGLTSETPFLPLESLQHPTASIRWFHAQTGGEQPGDGDPMLWLGWTTEDPDLFALRRMNYDTVTDTTVHGVPGFVATLADQEHLDVVWSEHGFTYTLGAWGLDPDALLAAANQLRPATAAEWNAIDTEPS